MGEALVGEGIRPKGFDPENPDLLDRKILSNMARYLLRRASLEDQDLVLKLKFAEKLSQMAEGEET